MNAPGRSIGRVPVSFFDADTVNDLAAIGRAYLSIVDVVPVDYRSIESLQKAARRYELARELEASVGANGVHWHLTQAPTRETVSVRSEETPNEQHERRYAP